MKLNHGDMLKAAFNKPDAPVESYPWIKKAVAKIIRLGGHLNEHNIASQSWHIYKAEKRKK
jgi:hypothetical protein